MDELEPRARAVCQETADDEGEYGGVDVFGGGCCVECVVYFCAGGEVLKVASGLERGAEGRGTKG